MARQSAALVSVAGNLGQRPDPPDDLTADQAKVWRATVASEASDFFRTDALRELLKDYCRHKVSGADLSSQIELYDPKLAMSPDVVGALDKLLKMRDRETKAAADKATKLRLTNQSRYTPQAASTAAKNASVQKKPWEVGA
jgi:hypothetical protein